MKPICIVVLCAVVSSGCVSSVTQARPPIFSTLDGRWDEVDPVACESYRTISFSDDNTRMLVSYPDGGYAAEGDARDDFVYTIYEVTDTMIRAELEDEPRLDDRGNPVVWKLHLIDRNSYCWGRDDWPAESCTPPRMRCEGS